MILRKSDNWGGWMAQNWSWYRLVMAEEKANANAVKSEPDDCPPHGGRAERTLPSVLVLAVPTFKK